MLKEKKFPTVQQGDQVFLTCIHYNYIFSPTLCSVATWVSRQSSQCYSAGPPCKSILSCVWSATSPDPSHSLTLPSGSHKSFLQVHGFLFCGDVHLCWILDSSSKWYHMVFVFSISGSFHSVWDSLVPSMLPHIAWCPPILSLSTIQLCIYTTSSESNHLLMDIWVVSMSWLLWIELRWTCLF